MGLTAEGQAPAHELPGEPCRRARSRLALLPGDELDAAEAGAVRAHVSGCFACARELGAHARAVGRLQALAAQDPTTAGRPDPAEQRFFAALKQSILAETAGEPAPAERARSGRRRVLAACAAAALFLLGLGLVNLATSTAPRLLGNSPLAVPSRPEPAEESRFSDLGRFSPEAPTGQAALGRGRTAGAWNALAGNIGLAGRITAARRIELVCNEPGSAVRWSSKKITPPGRAAAGR